jgi:hypothetical protein
LDDSLKSHLEFGEQCETDAGCLGHAPESVKCPSGIYGESWKHEMQQRVRSRQEMTINKKCLKNWALLSLPNRHNLYLHQTVFAAGITFLQLSFDQNPVFSVEYND